MSTHFALTSRFRRITLFPLRTVSGRVSDKQTPRFDIIVALVSVTLAARLLFFRN